MIAQLIQGHEITQNKNLISKPLESVHPTSYQYIRLLSSLEPSSGALQEKVLRCGHYLIQRVVGFATNVFMNAVASWKCESCVSSVTSKTTEWVMCAVYECGMDTPRHSFPTTADAVRKTKAQRQSQSIKNVCAAQAQSRDLNYCGPKTNAKVLTNNLLWIQLEKSCAEREVLVVHPPLWCPPWADHQRHSNFWLEAIVDLSFFPFPWFVLPRTCPPTIPLRWRWWGWVCFRSSDILDVVSLEDCLLQFVWSSIFFNESFYATDMAGCTPHFHRVLLTSRCPSVPVRPLCVFVGALVVCMFHLFPTICAAVEINLRSTKVFWICDSFSNTLSTMISQQGPKQLFRRWPTSMSSSGLFDDRALTTWEPLSIVIWACLSCSSGSPPSV